MNDDNFVSRWSRLKREAAQRRKASLAAEARDERPSTAQDAAARDDRAAAGGSPDAQRSEPEFDPASLPPIESIVAGSDIRAFLQKGVPAELTKAALRRAWTSDPAIRDFIGLAENQWDFTDPASIPGFGVLQASDDVGQLVARAMGKLPEVEEAVGLAQEPGRHAGPEADERHATPRSAVPSLDVADDSEAALEVDAPVDVAAAHNSAPVKSDVLPARKGHGRALPR